MIEVLKQARKAFELATTPLAKDRQEVLEAVAAINQAIAELESQEPKAWLHPTSSTSVTTNPTAYTRGIPLYAHPLKRTWVGLTDEWIESAGARWVQDGYNPYAFAKTVEAKLKEKNT